MLTVNLIAVGKLKEKFLREALAEYSKRLSAYCNFNIIEVDECRLPENPSQSQIEKGMEKEVKDILRYAAKGEIIAMCIEGSQLSSEGLATQLDQLSQRTGTVSFVIGGSFGLSDEVKKQACLRLSVSKMTFPHQLFRVMLAEQIYRAFSISSGGKYHK